MLRTLGRSRIGILAASTASLFYSRSADDRQQAATSSATHYDLIVIGGGSAGLACAKEAAVLGKRVAVLDYVEATPKGRSWGLGGTCINVGCIPKKLMHHIAAVGHTIRRSEECGWMWRRSPDHPELHFSWAVMTERVQNYIRSLNWARRMELHDNNIVYLNAKGRFLNSHTIKIVDKRKTEGEITADVIVIAVGGRPRYPDIPGARDCGITSDDLFWLQQAPGKTLIVGGGYVALECAGFLQEMCGPDSDTTVMVQEICLRKFDRQMANLVTDHLEKELHVRFLWSCRPVALERNELSGGVKVVWERLHTGPGEKAKRHEETYQTVIFAIGRQPSTSDLDLDRAGVEVNPLTGKVICAPGAGSFREQTTAPNVFAIGDVLEGGLELTTVASRSGKLLAQRLFGESQETMDYQMVPTAVFTPLEYAFIGMSEEEATSRLGPNNVEVYHAFYHPLEHVALDESCSHCYVKLICDRQQGDRVVGLHMTGPNASEVVPGFAAAIRLGVTRKQLCRAVGIHPTSAEEVTRLRITKRSGLDPTAHSC